MKHPILVLRGAHTQPHFQRFFSKHRAHAAVWRNAPRDRYRDYTFPRLVGTPSALKDAYTSHVTIRGSGNL